MGHEVEKAALERGHIIVGRYDSETDWNKVQMPECDVVIDFSTPENAPIIVNHCFDLNIPVVSGTTGWNELLPIYRERAVKQKKSFLYASNFSIGVNIVFAINKKLASLIGNQSNYSARIEEIHHIHKKDAPSGTAINLAQGILNNCNKYDGWLPERQEDNKITINSLRIGEIPGTHTVTWTSEIDTIELKHTAHNRSGFAIGAILAAEWLQGRNGSFSMEDVVN